VSLPGKNPWLLPTVFNTLGEQFHDFFVMSARSPPPLDDLKNEWS
jgi:hypothetical protein